MSFEGKVILITDGSSGIGAACAEYFANKGALLALVGDNGEKFENVIARIKEGGIDMEPLILLADISTDAELIITETIAKYNHLDILINSADFAKFNTLDTMKMANYDTMMDINVRALVKLTKLTIPYLIRTKGNIVNVSSGLAMIATPNAIGYAISKALIEQFTKCLAVDPSIARNGVRVNCVSPGIIDTEFHDSLTDTEYNTRFIDYCQMHPIQRIGTNLDCVNAIAFLADNTASFITGYILPGNFVLLKMDNMNTQLT